MTKYSGPLLALVGGVAAIVGAVVRGAADSLCEPRCSTVPGTVICIVGLVVCVTGVQLWRRAG
jgi:hypothetical protein